MLRAHDQDQLVFQYREGFKVPIGRFGSHECEIDIAFEYLTGQTTRHMPKDLDLDVRIFFTECEDEFGQEVKRSAFVGSHPNQSAFQTLKFSNCVPYLVPQRKNS